MVQEFEKEITPAIEQSAGGTSSAPLTGVDVLEIHPEKRVMISHHTGETGQTYADSRIVLPMRMTAKIVIPNGGANSNVSAHLKHLMNPSYSDSSGTLPMFAVSSFYTKCYNMAVVSSRESNTNERRNLRVLEVTFEECFDYEEANKDSQKTPSPANTDDAASGKQALATAGGGAEK